MVISYSNFGNSIEHDFCVPSVDIATPDHKMYRSAHSNRIYLEMCKFTKNKRPILKVLNDELSENKYTIFLSGHIEVSETRIGLWYSYAEENIAYMENMIVHITGPVTIAQNDVENIF